MEPEEIEKYKFKKVELPASPEKATTINCPSCGQHTPAEHLNINDKIAKCGHCHVVFSFQEDVLHLQKSAKTQQEVLRPEGIDVFYFKNDLDITMQQPWTALEIIVYSLLPLFVFLLTVIYFKGKIGPIMPLVSWGLAIMATINAAFRTKDKVHISISDRFLSIKWRPHKFNKDRFFPVQDIDQVYVKNVHGQFDVLLIVNNPGGQKHVKLVGGLSSISKARYLEQEIEWHLGIENRVVPEESI